MNRVREPSRSSTAVAPLRVKRIHVSGAHSNIEEKQELCYVKDRCQQREPDVRVNKRCRIKRESPNYSSSEVTWHITRSD